MTTPTKAYTYEPGYKAVLVREETKLELQAFRRALDDRDLNQERRLVTAAIEVVMARPELREALLKQVRDVVRRDLDCISRCA